LSLHDELRLMVQSGMSPMQALVAGTRTAAEYLNLNSTLGTVEAGRAANILLIDGDPLQDIAATRKIRQVIKDAQVIDTEQLFQ
jgi:imidazolonepropionase-like amidohydrolase